MPYPTQDFVILSAAKDPCISFLDPYYPETICDVIAEARRRRSRVCLYTFRERDNRSGPRIALLDMG
jgi:hypothetical protein